MYRNKMGKSELSIIIPILSLGKSGGYRVLSMLANNWKSEGISVKIIAYYGNDKPYYPIEADIIWIDENGKEMNENESQKNVKNSLLKRVKGIYIYLKNNQSKYNIVLANHNASVWPVHFGSKAINMYYIQAYEPEFYTEKNLRNIIQKFFAWFTYFLPLTQIVNAELYMKYKNLKSSYIIPPGLDLDLYHPKNHSNAAKKEFVVGCIGRSEEWKGSDDVAKAVRIVHEKGYDIRFKVAFCPVNYDRYELLKPDGDHNLAEFYRSLDVLVAPGHIQLGAVHYPVIEAMACKTPVITTGYYPANQSNAFIVPIKRPDIIAETIIGIMQNYDLANKKAEIAYENISQFDWKNVSSKFIEVFINELSAEKCKS